MPVGTPVKIDLPVKDVLKHLGIVKNELLIFVLIGVLLLNASAYPLDMMQDPWQKHGGLAMHLCSALMLMLFGAFYCFAIFRLPSSPQELQFEEDAKPIIKEHQRRQTKRKNADEPAQPENPN
jgi:hypothetical protein